MVYLAARNCSCNAVLIDIGKVAHVLEQGSQATAFCTYKGCRVYIPKCNIMHYTGHRKQWTVNQSGNWLVSLWSQKVLFDNKHGFHELLMSCASVCYEVCHGL